MVDVATLKTLLTTAVVQSLDEAAAEKQAALDREDATATALAETLALAEAEVDAFDCGDAEPIEYRLYSGPRPRPLKGDCYVDDSDSFNGKVLRMFDGERYTAIGTFGRTAGRDAVERFLAGFRMGRTLR